MTLETDSDRLALLKGDDEETFTIAGQQITAVFDALYAEPLDVESSAPRLVARSTDVADVAHGDTVIRELDSAEYQVANIQPDSRGMTLIRLEAQ